MSAAVRSALLVATLLGAVGLAREARASGTPAGLTGDFRSGVGLAAVTYDEGSAKVADFEAAVFSVGLRLGVFIGHHVVFGTELAALHGRMTSSLRVREPRFFDGEPSNTTYGYLAPLGAFIELYPWARRGFFVSASGGVGMMQLPRFSREAEGGGTMARYALELGYDPSRVEIGWDVFVRLEHWRGIEGRFAAPDGIVSSHVLIGFRGSPPLTSLR